MTGDEPPEGWVPYADGTSGHQGDSSRDAEPDRRGKMAQTLEVVMDSGTVGVTWYDVAMTKNWYQGSCGSNLSNLHRSGIICRLKERRVNRGVYVLPEHVRGRETVPFNGKRAVRSVGTIIDGLHGLLDELEMDDQEFFSERSELGSRLIVVYTKSDEAPHDA
jgi:hypothetical protein